MSIYPPCIQFYYQNYRDEISLYRVAEPKFEFCQTVQYVDGGFGQLGLFPEWVIHGTKLDDIGLPVGRRTFRLSRIIGGISDGQS